MGYEVLLFPFVKAASSFIEHHGERYGPMLYLCGSSILEGRS